MPDALDARPYALTGPRDQAARAAASGAGDPQPGAEVQGSAGRCGTRRALRPAPATTSAAPSSGPASSDWPSRWPASAWSAPDDACGDAAAHGVIGRSGGSAASDLAGRSAARPREPTTSVTSSSAGTGSPAAGSVRITVPAGRSDGRVLAPGGPAPSRPGRRLGVSSGRPTSGGIGTSAGSEWSADAEGDELVGAAEVGAALVGGARGAPTAAATAPARDRTVVRRLDAGQPQPGPEQAEQQQHDHAPAGSAATSAAESCSSAYHSPPAVAGPPAARGRAHRRPGPRTSAGGPAGACRIRWRRRTSGGSARAAGGSGRPARDPDGGSGRVRSSCSPAGGPGGRRSCRHCSLVRPEAPPHRADGSSRRSPAGLPWAGVRSSSRVAGGWLADVVAHRTSSPDPGGRRGPSTANLVGPAGHRPGSACRAARVSGVGVGRTARPRPARRRTSDRHLVVPPARAVAGRLLAADLAGSARAGSCG